MHQFCHICRIINDVLVQSPAIKFTITLNGSCLDITGFQISIFFGSISQGAVFKLFTVYEECFSIARSYVCHIVTQKAFLILTTVRNISPMIFKVDATACFQHLHDLDLFMHVSTINIYCLQFLFPRYRKIICCIYTLSITCTNKILNKAKISTSNNLLKEVSEDTYHRCIQLDISQCLKKLAFWRTISFLNFFIYLINCKTI